MVCVICTEVKRENHFDGEDAGSVLDSTNVDQRTCACIFAWAGSTSLYKMYVPLPISQETKIIDDLNI